MSYYVTCPHCGANLDPGERCDCLKDFKRSKRDDYFVAREARKIKRAAPHKEQTAQTNFIS